MSLALAGTALTISLQEGVVYIYRKLSTQISSNNTDKTQNDLYDQELASNHQSSEDNILKASAQESNPGSAGAKNLIISNQKVSPIGKVIIDQSTNNLPVHESYDEEVQDFSRINPNISDKENPTIVSGTFVESESTPLPTHNDETIHISTENIDMHTEISKSSYRKPKILFDTKATIESDTIEADIEVKSDFQKTLYEPLMRRCNSSLSQLSLALSDTSTIRRVPSTLSIKSTSTTSSVTLASSSSINSPTQSLDGTHSVGTSRVPSSSASELLSKLRSSRSHSRLRKP